MNKQMESDKRIRWAGIFSEAELYKAAIRLYTTPVFNWRKALSHSGDDRTFYDFARHGLKNLDALYASLYKRKFRFRPGLSLDFNFNGHLRTVYVYPWEERLVDLLLYRILDKRLDRWFSRHSYAYRIHSLGIDLCQRRVARALNESPRPVYVVKRDLSDYFNSIDQETLLQKLRELVEEDDYLFQLLLQRVHFRYFKDDRLLTASRGVPFGTAAACLFANIYLTGLDRACEAIKGVHYFRYSDDILFFSSDKGKILEALSRFDSFLAQLKLRDKASHRFDILFSQEKVPDPDFKFTDRFKHLGLQFRANGLTGLSRDKCRKICNIFRYALRRKHGRLARIKDIEKKTDAVIGVINQVLNEGIRNIAIIDYYLRHVKDECQLRSLDRWLAEEALAAIFSKGHKKGHFRKISFKTLRERGLPSLIHRRRMMAHGHIATSFFRWKNYQFSKAYKGTAARPFAQDKIPAKSVFSPFPEAAAVRSS